MVKNLKIRIITPRQVIFNGLAKSVSSKNSVGRFDILPTHANFITVVENSPIIVKKVDNTTVKFDFPLAIIYTKDDQVNIYTEIQLPQI